MTVESDQEPRETTTRSPGRPRLYAPDVERDRILSAAIEVLRRNAGQDATVGEILHEATLSTRAFYRHFETKEDVIRALYDRDAASFAAHLRRCVEAAGEPRAALVTWVNEMLGLAYDRRRAERMSALSSPIVFRVVAGTDMQAFCDDLLVQPLHQVLEAGLASGDFPDAKPGLDVHAIRAITWEAVNWARAGRVRLSRKASCEYVVRFCWGALGARD